MYKVYLSLGSNLRDRLNNLHCATLELGKFLSNLKVSHIYESDPLYFYDQPKFLNSVVSGFTDLSCSKLLTLTQKIEQEMGRDRSSELSKGPRVLDIDIILYGDFIIDSAILKIPHPGIEERKFVLLPLLELDPDLKNPLSGCLLSECLPRIKDQGVYTYFPEEYNS